MERRKYPRYPVRLRVYFPEHNLWGYTTNVSLDGCFVKVERFISEGFLADLLLELPVIGVVYLKGYVHHTGANGEGLGMQFVQVRFASEESDYYSLYADFLKLMPRLEDIRSKYLALIQSEKLKLQTFPKEEP